MKRLFLLSSVLFAVAACQAGITDPATPSDAPERASAEQALVGSPAGSIPNGFPARLQVGLFEDTGATWMKSSGVKFDTRYRYFTKGWANNWGWGAYDGAFALQRAVGARRRPIVPAPGWFAPG